MRRDRQLFDAIDEDRVTERDSSGCCVRRDNSGCVQVLDQFTDCPVSPPVVMATNSLLFVSSVVQCDCLLSAFSFGTVSIC